MILLSHQRVKLCLSRRINAVFFFRAACMSLFRCVPHLPLTSQLANVHNLIWWTGISFLTVWTSNADQNQLRPFVGPAY